MEGAETECQRYIWYDSNPNRAAAEDEVPETAKQ
jgi:hypothetical protein